MKEKREKERDNGEEKNRNIRKEIKRYGGVVSGLKREW